MPLDELEQLSDLIGLRLAVDLLEIQELRDTGVHEDVMIYDKDEMADLTPPPLQMLKRMIKAELEARRTS